MTRLKVFVARHPVAAYFALGQLACSRSSDGSGSRSRRSGGATESLFVAMLMHVSLTAGLLMLNPIGISGANLLVFSFAFAAAVWVVVAAIVGRTGWHLEHRPVIRATSKHAA